MAQVAVKIVTEGQETYMPNRFVYVTKISKQSKEMLEARGFIVIFKGNTKIKN